MKDVSTMTPETFVDYCRAHGMKCTAQRLAVFSSLHGRRHHPSVDEVWMSVRAQLPTVTRESVYRIMNEFVSEGLIERMDSFSAARYDTCVGPHAHFVCEKCGEIVDYPMPENFKLSTSIRGEQHHLELRIRGICENCLRG